MHLEMITITNPNPRPLCVWRGPLLLETLRPHDQLLLVVTADLRVSTERGKSLVLFDLDGDEWVQAVTDRKVFPDPEKALARPKAAANG